jgi:hypothetical protein
MPLSNDLEHQKCMSQLACRMARALGQDEALLNQVEAQEAHPAMAAYGLWRDEPDLVTLADEINANRVAQHPLLIKDWLEQGDKP